MAIFSNIFKKNSASKSKSIPPENFSESRIKIIAGLGNPGKKYEKTYHNAGFLFLDYLISLLPDQSISPSWSEYKNFEFIKTKNFILIRPLTFMNDSGKAVSEALKYFSAKPENLLIVHDDADISAGNFKFSINRGSAGHKGIESIINALKTKKFWRLRIGIAGKSRVKQKAGDMVLKNIPPERLKKINEAFSKTVLKLNI